MNYGFIKVAAGAAPIRVADCIYNRAQIADAILHYAKHGTEVVFFPQLSVTGATCGDLFLQNTLIDEALNSLIYIAQATKSCEVLSFVGLPFIYEDRLYNCMAACFGGKILGIIPSPCSAAYNMQNARYFTEWHGENTCVIINNSEIAFGSKLLFCPTGHSAKISCASVQAADAGMIYTQHALAGANIIGLCAAQPERAENYLKRRNEITAESLRLMCGIAAAYAGEGESTTDGAYSGYCQIAECGNMLSQSPLFSRSFAVSDIDTDYICAQRSKSGFPLDCNGYTKILFALPCPAFLPTSAIAQNPYLPHNTDDYSEFYQRILNICAHSLAKRLAHSGSSSAVIGISGGLDSCLALFICVRAFNILKLPLTSIYAYSMPCFGTSERTRRNAELLCNALGVTLKEIDITNSVLSHFKDIEHSENQHDVTFENAQARMRTLILMNMANKQRGLVIGTGDLSELALGFATYGGDHISMYGVNAGIPKTMIRLIIAHIANSSAEDLRALLTDILQTPVSPELLPANNGEIAQITEDIVGPYALHDFFIYYMVHCAFKPKKIFALAVNAFNGVYDKKTILKWLRSFYARFFAQQFKRSCMPDGPAPLSISLSPRGGLMMPSDASANIWKEELNSLEKEI